MLDNVLLTYGRHTDEPLSRAVGELISKEGKIKTYQWRIRYKKMTLNSKYHPEVLFFAPYIFMEELIVINMFKPSHHVDLHDGNIEKGSEDEINLFGKFDNPSPLTGYPYPSSTLEICYNIEYFEKFRSITKDRAFLSSLKNEVIKAVIEINHKNNDFYFKPYKIKTLIR